MQFFLYEILARIVAIYLCWDCSRTLWQGFVDRKIAYVGRGDALDWFVDLFLDRTIWIARRDATPVQYWIQFGLHTMTLAACVVVAIFGWWHPTT